MKYRLVFIKLSLLLYSMTLSAQCQNVSHVELKGYVTSSFRARAECLANSTGKAKIKLIRNFDRVKAEELKKIAETKLGRDMSGVGYEGENEISVNWYKKDTKNRFDVIIPKPKGKNYLKEKNIKCVTDTQKSIFYNLLEEVGGIDRPLTKLSNPSNIIDYFDIDRVYTFYGKPIPEYFEEFEKAGILGTITNISYNNESCIQLTYITKVKQDEQIEQVYTTSFIFCPKKSFSAVKCEFTLDFYKNKEKFLSEGEKREISYKESSKRSGIWLINNLILDHKIGELSEHIEITIEDQKIEEKVNDDVFTFEGLGLPEGKDVYDRRLRSQPIIYK